MSRPAYIAFDFRLASRLSNIPASGKGEDRLMMADYDMLIYGWRATSSDPDRTLVRIADAARNDPWMNTPISISAWARGVPDRQPGYFVIPKIIPAGNALLIEVFNVGASPLAFAEIVFFGIVWRTRGKISVATRESPAIPGARGVPA